MIDYLLVFERAANLFPGFETEIRQLRQVTNWPMDAVLARALKALRELPVPEQTDSPRGSEPKLGCRGSNEQEPLSTPAMSPGDKSGAPEAVAVHVAASAARRSAGKYIKGKKDHRAKDQSRMDI